MTDGRAACAVQEPRLTHARQGRLGDVRSHHTSQDGKQFKTYALSIPGNFHLRLLDHGDWTVVTEALEGQL